MHNKWTAKSKVVYNDESRFLRAFYGCGCLLHSDCNEVPAICLEHGQEFATIWVSGDEISRKDVSSRLYVVEDAMTRS